jgi:hypothetical protein
MPLKINVKNFSRSNVNHPPQTITETETEPESEYIPEPEPININEEEEEQTTQLRCWAGLSLGDVQTISDAKTRLEEQRASHTPNHAVRENSLDKTYTCTCKRR